MSPTTTSIHAARAGVLPARVQREDYAKAEKPRPKRPPARPARLIAPPCVIKAQDCFSFLDAQPSNSADLFLTDPPYAISRETGFKGVVNGEKRFAVSMDFGEWDHAEIDLPRLAKAMLRVLRKGGAAVVWYDIWKISRLGDALREAGFAMLRVLVWEKVNPVPLNSGAFYLSNGREIAVAAVKGGSPVFNSEYDNGLVVAPIPRHNGKRVHPTQKPADLFAGIIRKHTRPGGVVIDPFLGSGTTAVAAIESGREFRGCEIDPNYARQARERAKNAGKE